MQGLGPCWCCEPCDGDRDTGSTSNAHDRPHDSRSRNRIAVHTCAGRPPGRALLYGYGHHTSTRSLSLLRLRDFIILFLMRCDGSLGSCTGTVQQTETCTCAYVTGNRPSLQCTAELRAVLYSHTILQLFTRPVISDLSAFRAIFSVSRRRLPLGPVPSPRALASGPLGLLRICWLSRQRPQ